MQPTLLNHWRTGPRWGYTYRYDQLNRLTGMRRNNIAAGSASWNSNSPIEAYREEITYDANGNIKTYIRNGDQPGNYAMDNLTYHYNLDSKGRLANNKLRHVIDPVVAGAYLADIDNQSVDNYQYDNIGNMVKDQAENLDRINWTVYGKIASIKKLVGGIDYGYDAQRAAH